MDKELFKLIEEEEQRQFNGIELIASENYVSSEVLKALGSICTNKYAEGYPGHRYYGGCQYIDEIEQLAIDRVCKLYNCEYANVQPHSGSQANRAAIEAVCNPGDTILSLHLDHGGHLTHGSPVSFSGKYYNIVNYHTGEDGRIDYDELLRLAEEKQPKLIIAGASAYAREWNYDVLLDAKKISGAVLMFDMAHTAGLIAAGLLENPCKYCDIVTSTTHKTLRGPRGGIILLPKDFENTKNEKDNKGNIKMMSTMINSSVFPGNQGGPLENSIAAKAVCFYEALQPEFIEYQKQVLKNTKVLGEEFVKKGYKLVSGGTDNHLILVDLRQKFPNLTGKQAEKVLQDAEITTNKNMVPFDNRSPFQTSGLRLGCAAITTRGFKEEDVKLIAKYINNVLESFNLYQENHMSEEEYNNIIIKIKKKILNLTKDKPLFADDYR